MMPHNRLGNSDIFVSAIGLGTVKFGRNAGVKYPEQFNLPTAAEISDLLAFAHDLGINLLDTAPSYGSSEVRLGEALRGQRNNWVLCSKVGEEFSAGVSQYDFSPAAIRHSVERSLRRLNTDYLDLILVHSNGDDVKIIEECAVFATLNSLKQAGWIRAFGMSTKTVAGGKLAVEHSDAVMVTYNPVQTEEQAVIQFAHEKQKGVLIKKALASGHLQKIPGADPVRAAMDFIFREPGVSSVIIGTLNKTHLAHDVACVGVVKA